MKKNENKKNEEKKRERRRKVLKQEKTLYFRVETLK
jgi:hypothetical protein